MNEDTQIDQSVILLKKYHGKKTIESIILVGTIEPAILHIDKISEDMDKRHITLGCYLIKADEERSFQYIAKFEDDVWYAGKFNEKESKWKKI